MSYEIIKSITINEFKQEVFITSASSNVYPKEFCRGESKYYEKLLKKEGIRSVLQDMGQEIYSGSWHLRKGTKINNAFLEATQWVPKEFNWDNVATKTVGNFIGNCVYRMIYENIRDFSEMQKKLRDEVGTKEYALWMAEKWGKNSISLCSEELQNNREFNLELVKKGSWGVSFNFPKKFLCDKEIVMEGLKVAGCLYRQLPNELKRDREVILSAFKNDETKVNVEHLLNEIPKDVFFIVDEKGKVLKDAQGKSVWNEDGRDFFVELLNTTPNLHVWNAKDFFTDMHIVYQMYKYCRYKSDVVAMIPKCIGESALNTGLVQQALYETCENEADVAKLKKNLRENNVILAPSMYEKLKTTEGKETVFEILREKKDWLNAMATLAEYQTDLICEDRLEQYPLEIIEIETKDGMSITNPFIDSTGRFSIQNPIREYGKENIKYFLETMNEEIGCFLKNELNPTLRWDMEKVAKEIDIYCRAMSHAMER